MYKAIKSVKDYGYNPDLLILGPELMESLFYKIIKIGNEECKMTQLEYVDYCKTYKEPPEICDSMELFKKRLLALRL